jgi:phosphoribosylaminoimidazole-succinocarboxamide synthase
MNTKMISSIKVDYLLDLCLDLELNVKLYSPINTNNQIMILGPKNEKILIEFENSKVSLIEQILSQIVIDFEQLPLLVQGDSKEIRLLTPKIALARLLPTVYSYTHNRYGIAPGTDKIRTLFSANIFRKMSNEPGPYRLASAFLGIVKSENELFLAEQVVETCNLEIRVKRFHIGSPIYRYLYTDEHPTHQNGPPLQRWSRFQKPIVCFDWRHPLYDREGKRLADEPLPDDYAALWIDNIDAAKKLAKNTFLWLEQKFYQAGLLLVDICFFIDRTGNILYGEISPDCMRIREGTSTDSRALDKDVWRSGGKPRDVLANYTKLYKLMFGEQDILTHHLS